MDTRTLYAPTAHQLEQAEKRATPVDPFYQVATTIVRLARQGQAGLPISSALAALLLNWNQAYYQYHPKKRKYVAGDLHKLLARHRPLKRFGGRSIASLCPRDEKAIKCVFEAFDERLGPVGAAKALHLLAPRFFPLWDRKIAKAYGVGGLQNGRASERYIDFMWITRWQHRALGGERAYGRRLLKRLDEFNYWRYTRGEI